MATISTFAAFSSRGYGAFTSGRLVPTGGDFVIDNNGAGKRVHVFLQGGSFTVPEGALGADKFVDLEILVVGGGGPAGSAGSTGGGGGGGGAVIYDSAFRIPKGQSLSVTVGGAGAVSKVTGLHAAPGGGSGGSQQEYSKGQPGGSGGGGSWQNGGPNGGEYTTSNPGSAWGTVGPSGPAGVTPAFPTPALGPAYAPGLNINKAWNTGYHNNRGNGQYGCSSATPDSSKGIAGSITSPAPGTSYSPKAFRMRGGGGSSYVGGLGGQGIWTDFRNLENGWEFMLAGGHGDFPNTSDRSWDQLKRISDAKALTDSGVYNGTFYDARDSYLASPTQANWETGYDNPVQTSVENAPSGSETYGSGGSRTHEQDGGRGFLILRYLDSAVTGSSANVFGGTTSTSANGQYRYHIWYGDSASDGSYKGTSANSQGYIAFNDESNYRAKYFNSNTEEAYYTVKGKDGQARGANTTPFYFYQDVPAFTVQYMLVGGGGAMGTRGDSGQPGGLNYLVGGGGSGGIKIGSFTSHTVQAPSSYTMDSLPQSLANGDGFQVQTTGSFSHRLGYIEVRANSLLSPKLSTSKYLSSLDNVVDAYHKQRSGTIRIRGSGNESARLLQRLQRTTINEGYFADNAISNTDRRYLFFGSSNPGNPQSDGWGESINISDGYESYFYTNYTRVRAGRKFHLMDSETSGPKTQYSEGNPSWNNNVDFTLGTGSSATTFVATPTGTHPQTNESYYNALRVDRALPKYSSGGDDLGTNRYSQFQTAIENFNSSSLGWEEKVPAMQTGLHNVDSYWDRNFNMRVSDVFGSGRTLYGSYVLQQGENATTRYFVHIDGWNDGYHNINVPQGWKIINVESGTTNRMTYTNDNGDDIKTRVEVWRRSLRKIWIRHLFALDTCIGHGGKGNKQPTARRRSGGVTSLHEQDDDSPLVSAGGGGAGGWHTYSNEGESPVDTSGTTVSTSNREPGTYLGAGVGNNPMNWGLLTPAGSGGGGAFSMTSLADSSNPVPGGTGFVDGSGSSSDTLSSYAGGGGGGGSISSREFTMVGAFKVGGATRGSIFSNGRDPKKNASYSTGNDVGHGGRGWFGSATNWAGEIGSENISGTTYYYYVNVNQFPHNAEFAAGGGGGANSNGEDGSGTSGGTGGNGGTGVSYSLTGYATLYGHGGGGMGRFVNGTPGSSQPANPADQTVPSGAPNASLYLPYGGGGGYSAGRQEGLGSGATGYYPGNAPWPTAYDVSFGTAHMDYMRYVNSNVPGPQKGDFGTAYGGKQGVVIISYDRAPYFS
jgi:hypothetical protein